MPFRQGKRDGLFGVVRQIEVIILEDILTFICFCQKTGDYVENFARKNS